MPALLKIDVSPRTDTSVSRKLGAMFVERFLERHPGSSVVNRDLAAMSIPLVDVPWIMNVYSPEEARTPEGKASLKLGDEFIDELQAADHILITTPMYNFSVPAVLKAWIDQVVRIGKTVRIDADGSRVGLIQGKKVTIIIASGGSYHAGSPYETYNAERPYLKQILGYIGLQDITFVEAGGTAVLNWGKGTIEEFVVPFADTIKDAAS